MSEADNGSEALRLAADQPFDLILMDLQMPGIDGFASARAIRQSDTRNRETPIIALSADVMSHQLAEYDGFDIDGVLAKPIDSALLFQTVRQYASGA